LVVQYRQVRMHSTIEFIIADEPVKLLCNQYKCYKTDETPIVFLMCFLAEYVFTCFHVLQSFVWLQNKNM